MLVEAGYGGVSPATRAAIGYQARRVTDKKGKKRKGVVDRTKYGTTRRSTRSFYTHHMQMIVKAAVVYDSRNIRAQVTCAKQRFCTGAA